MSDGAPHQADRRAHLQLAVMGVAVAAAASVVAWLLVRDHRPPTIPTGKPALVSQAELERFAAETDHAVYWAGPKPGYEYELTAADDDRTFLRYLPRGVPAGDPHPDFLVVGTYLQRRAYADLQEAAKRAGAVRATLEHGGLAVAAAANAKSVYFAYPGRTYQVEVYAPTGGAAHRLVLAGEITPIR